MSAILGISAYYHDAAACLLIDGDVVAAAQEERFSRQKHDARFPREAARFCLRQAGIQAEELDYVSFYDKPVLKFDRLIKTYLDAAPHGLRSFLRGVPPFIAKKLFLDRLVSAELARLHDPEGVGTNIKQFRQRLLFSSHHESHAASAFYPSPYDEAAILTIDGVGEWATATVGVGKEHDIKIIEELRFPHSLGLLYSAFTDYIGFKVNSDEFKVMGLAPYGEPRYVNLILARLMDLRDDGSFRLRQEWFDYRTGFSMTAKRFSTLFGEPRRAPDSPLTQHEMDLARSIQDVTEEIVIRMARHAHRLTGQRYLVMAGGVALNCVANARVLREGPFDDLWVQPAAGDAGGALGAAFCAWHRYLRKPRKSQTCAESVKPETADEGRMPRRRTTMFTPDPCADKMKGAFLGPHFAADDIAQWLTDSHLPFTWVSPADLPNVVAELLAKRQVVGLLQGRMEFGPRALGARSIIADPRPTWMQAAVNEKIKFRETFRPFAPSILAEHVGQWFDLDRESPYMLLVANVLSSRRRPLSVADQSVRGLAMLDLPRSEIPSVTHVDYSARVHTVQRDTSPLFYDIIAAFYAATRCPLILNTSFNVRGEPIVCSPQDAYRCFMHTGLEALVLENCVLLKDQQP